jgi:hypothetical protein
MGKNSPNLVTLPSIAEEGMSNQMTKWNLPTDLMILFSGNKYPTTEPPGPAAIVLRERACPPISFPTELF